MVTIYDVAALAHVSASTVSRVFNGLKVSVDRAHAVRSAAAELGFVPNQAARALRTQRTDLITLIIADIENPFFTAMARGVEDAARVAGFSVMLCNTDEDPEKEATYLKIAALQHVSGVIIAPASEHLDVTEVTKGGRPLVTVDRPVLADVDSVVVDNRARGYQSVERLVADGHRRIACVTGPEYNETAQHRAQGWSDAVRRLGLGYAPEDLLVYSNNKVDGGYQSVTDLLHRADPPDAIFVANNMMGIGALEAITEAGRSPRSIGLAVSGDLPLLMATPKDVHVISMPARQIGETATRILIERIGGDTQPSRTVVVR